MDISPADLKAAAARSLITEEQAERLWQFLAERKQDTPRFTFTHILYYLGGLIAIGAMSLFMTLGWERFGGTGLALIAVGYGLVALRLADWFLEKKRLAIPAGIMATLAVVLVPLAVYGAQQALGYWPGRAAYREYHAIIDWRWLMMEFATLAAGAVMLWRYRLPFMVMPIAVTLWYMSMDLVPMLFGVERWSWELGKFVSLWFGLLMALGALWIDLRTRSERDFAFWLYLFGVLTFWGGLSAMESKDELSKLGYCAINVLMILTGAVLSRRVFAVFGGMGVAGYLGHLSWRVFKDSVVFPFVLTAIGLGIVFAGIWWQRREAQISVRLRAWLPEPMRELIERRS